MAIPDPISTPLTTPAKPSFYEAFCYWLKLGFISFGGPTGQIALLHHDLVERRRWISENRFLHALNFCMVLPGPEATQLAVYIGWLMHRTWGGIMAGVLFVLPGFLVLVGLSWVYVAFGNVPAIAGVLYGIKPAVTAIVVFAAWRIGSRTLKNGLLWGIAAAAFIAILAFKIPFPAIVAAAALIGAIGGRLTPHFFRIGGSHGAAKQSYGPAVIDDNAPLEPHHRFNKTHTVLLLLAFIGVWAGAMQFLNWQYGWNGLLTQMGWFFTKAALLTFGGAYAVLPYVYQGAVENFHWLTATQMIDGLALGETTPGPLIMVVAFVGFIGGWTHTVFGAGHPFLAGAAAATVVTFFTFLPSFLFVLLGGPLIETTRGNLKFTAPLSAITAAVVGVILNLAVFFAWHILWPKGIGEPFEWPAALICIGALIALFHYKVGIIPLIGVCGIIGLIVALISF